MSQVFVRGFDFGTEEEVLKELFGAYGAISDFKLNWKGSALVTFATEAEAAAAIAGLDQSIVPGNTRYIDVTLGGAESFKKRKKLGGLEVAKKPKVVGNVKPKIVKKVIKASVSDSTKAAVGNFHVLCNNGGLTRECVFEPEENGFWATWNVTDAAGKQMQYASQSAHPSKKAAQQEAAAVAFGALSELMG